MATTSHDFGKPNGTMVLPPRWLGLWPKMTVHGGPFRNCGRDVFGVCLLERRLWQRMPDVWFPIEDFHTPGYDPEATTELNLALRETFMALLDGREVYVGCMGGLGRTGLFMALLVKVAADRRNPVAFLRENYVRRAVETPEQEAFVADFDARPLRRWLWRETLGRRFGLPALRRPAPVS
jgi:hypothetical protein